MLRLVRPIKKLQIAAALIVLSAVAFFYARMGWHWFGAVVLVPMIGVGGFNRTVSGYSNEAIRLGRKGFAVALITIPIAIGMGVVGFAYWLGR